MNKRKYKAIRVKGPEGCYFTICVFNELKEMYEHCDKLMKEAFRECHDHNFNGICIPQETYSYKTGEEVRLKNSGYILVCKKTLSMPIMVHELVHAAMFHERKMSGNETATFGV